MGVKHSKRSVDISETSTKGEIEGFGHEGKVDKISDAVVEKVAVNGHIDDLQNGGEVHQNGIEPIQNGEAPAIVAEKAVVKENDEPVPEAMSNGQVEASEVIGEAEKIEEPKKTDEKKEKKKEKKEKAVKKKFSLRNFSFSKKDKGKAPKEEKSPEKLDEAGTEETPNSNEENETVISPSQGEEIEVPEVGSTAKVTEIADAVGNVITVQAVPEVDEVSADKMLAMAPGSNAISGDLPPPLPASPPPSEPVEAKPTDSEESGKSISVISNTITEKLEEVTSSFSNSLKEPQDSEMDIPKFAEKIAIETGKQIEEKATDLLKTVEQRAEESLKTANALISQQVDKVVETFEKAVSENEVLPLEKEEAMQMDVGEAASKGENEESGVPMNASHLNSAAEKAEAETADKDELGAGEGMAEDMPENIGEVLVEKASPDSLEAATILSNGSSVGE